MFSQTVIIGADYICFKNVKCNMQCVHYVKSNRRINSCIMCIYVHFCLKSVLLLIFSGKEKYHRNHYSFVKTPNGLTCDMVLDCKSHSPVVSDGDLVVKNMMITWCLWRMGQVDYYLSNNAVFLSSCLFMTTRRRLY